MEVLLVEDRPEQAQIVECYLEMALPGVQVHKAETLTEALVQMNENSFGAVLLDLGLPDSDGITTVSILHDSHPEQPIIVLTSAGEEGLGALCLQAGAHDFLNKAEISPPALEKALSFASLRQSEQAHLSVQRELDYIRKINGSPTRDIPDSGTVEYQSYLEEGDPSLSKATELLNRLLDMGVQPTELLSLHVVALEGLAQTLSEESLASIAQRSCYMALSMSTALSQLGDSPRVKLGSSPESGVALLELPQKSQLLAKFGGVPRIMNGIIENFVKNFDTYLVDIGAAIEAQDSKALAKIVHSLKGSLGYFSQGPIYDQLQKIEDLSRDDQLSEAGQLFENSREDLTVLRNHLEGMVEH